LKIFIQNRLTLKILLLLIFVTIISFLGCSKEKKINEDTFVLIYTDMVIAQDSMSAGSTGFEIEKKNIYSRYNVDKELYIHTLDYYKKNPEEWKKLFDKIISYLKEKGKSSI